MLTIIKAWKLKTSKISHLLGHQNCFSCSCLIHHISAGLDLFDHLSQTIRRFELDRWIWINFHPLSVCFPPWLFFMGAFVHLLNNHVCCILLCVFCDLHNKYEGCTNMFMCRGHRNIICYWIFLWTIFIQGGVPRLHILFLCYQISYLFNLFTWADFKISRLRWSVLALSMEFCYALVFKGQLGGIVIWADRETKDDGELSTPFLITG